MSVPAKWHRRGHVRFAGFRLVRSNHAARFATSLVNGRPAAQPLPFHHAAGFLIFQDVLGFVTCASFDYLHRPSTVCTVKKWMDLDKNFFRWQVKTKQNEKKY